MSLERKLKNAVSKEGIKNFVINNAWAIGFGVYHGVTSGSYSGGLEGNLEEFKTGALWFGLIWPLVHEVSSKRHRGFPKALTEADPKKVLWKGAQGASAYFIARNIAQYVVYQTM